MSVAAAADRLATILDLTPPQLAALTPDDAQRRPKAGQWAPKEILGHLIDSASNNHQRFVRGQISPSVADPSYDQETWVAAQNYIAEPWPDLIWLWVMLNRHLLHIMRTVREEALDTPISIRDAVPVPLSQVMIDYVSHLEHHLAQILPS